MGGGDLDGCSDGDGDYNGDGDGAGDGDADVVVENHYTVVQNQYTVRKSQYVVVNEAIRESTYASSGNSHSVRCSTESESFRISACQPCINTGR